MAQNVYRTPLPVLPEFQPRRSRHFSGSVHRPASLLTGLRDLMGHRPRSESLGGKDSQRPLRKVQIVGCRLEDVYDLREDEGDELADQYEDLHAFRRPRCNSSDFLILRKTSRPLSVDVVGLVGESKVKKEELPDAQSDPYRQYMKVVDCYELQPQHGNVILLDSNIKVDRAFHALCEQNVGAGLLWDSSKNEVTSLVSWTDFLNFLQTHHDPISTLPISACTSENRLVKVEGETKLFDVCEEFCANRVHRIVVMEQGTGNVVYLLTLKRVLQAIHKQNRSLHFAQWLSCPIGESRLGHWGEVTVVREDECLSAAVRKLLDFRLSSLPVLDSTGRARDLLYKDDIAKAMRHKKDVGIFFDNCKVGEVLGGRDPARFVSPREPISAVLDTLLVQKHCRCIFALGDDGRPVGCVSLSDFMSHLLHSAQPFRGPNELLGPRASN